jgi:hypothetical protein
MGADIADPGERRAHRKRLLDLLSRIKRELESHHDIFSNPDVVNGLLSLSKCPDFIVNKGHYFGTDLQRDEAPLSDADKRALIAFLETF